MVRNIYELFRTQYNIPAPINILLSAPQDFYINALCFYLVR